MNYKVVRQNKTNLPTYGKYRAVAIHEQTVTQRDVEEEIQANCSAKASDVKLVLTELASSLALHLKKGDKVVLERLGTLKLEIESRAVDSENAFNAGEHIKGVRLHFIPESYRGRQDMYQDIHYHKSK
ncbi:MAG: hypothetical protein IJ196_00560 [Prevotella sp.]|nr:hypothetical protein [Prevotella sp.]